MLQSSTDCDSRVAQNFRRLHALSVHSQLLFEWGETEDRLQVNLAYSWNRRIVVPLCLVVSLALASQDD